MDYEQKEQEKSRSSARKWAIGIGLAVYAGVVLVTSSMTMAFIGGIFAADQYFLATVVKFGVGLVALNSVALPYALHVWAVDGWHRAAGIVAYIVEIGMMAVNGVVSFSTLAGHPPSWVLDYSNYSVAMFIIPLASWGVLLMLDPAAQRTVAEEQAKQRLQNMAWAQVEEMLKGQVGQDEAAKTAANLFAGLTASIAPAGHRVDTGAQSSAENQRQYQAEVEVVENPTAPVSRKRAK